MRKLSVCLFLSILSLAALPSSIQASDEDSGGGQAEDAGKHQAACALLDQPGSRALMDGLLYKLLNVCGREHELGRVRQETALGDDTTGAANATGAADAGVNDPVDDAGGSSHTQSETVLAVNEETGTVCSAFNDSYGPVADGLMGFARSTDGGQTWDDRGPLVDREGQGLVISFGDPSLVWRRADGHFYFASLVGVDGIGVWRSIDDCRSVEFLGSADFGFLDDKELMAVDNHPGSPFFGRLYLAWTDFGSAGEIFSSHSSDGGITWSSRVQLTSGGGQYTGAWPVVAPNGDLYVGWVRWNPFPNGPIRIEIVRSTDGGQTFQTVKRPMSGETNPRDSAASATCGRPALAGNIRYLPAPQLAIGPDGALHVVYSYDPDGFGKGDVIDVFYRKSIDSGASWLPEVRLNDDDTDRDQYFPTLSVSPDNVVATTWYDRRLDPDNLLIDTYQRISVDGGNSWQASTRLSDVSTPVFLDPELATCYHGDYDMSLVTTSTVMAQWADDRAVQDGHNDSDVYFESTPISTDFLILPDPLHVDVCTPDEAVIGVAVPQFRGFAEPVTLSVSGLPGSLSGDFSVDPVTPPGTTELTIGDTAAGDAGSAEVQIIGTSSPGAIEHSAMVHLGLANSTPGSVVLRLPLDGARNVSVRPTLTWRDADQGLSYEVEIATDPEFGNVVYSATTREPRHQIDTTLPVSTQHYWRVRAINACDVGPFSDVFTWTIRPEHFILLVDEDEQAPDSLTYYEEALAAAGLDYDLWDISRGLVDGEPTAEDLAPYQWVIWFTGSGLDPVAGPGAEGQAALATWLASGGKCWMLTSQHFLHVFEAFPEFMNEYLGITGLLAPSIETVDGAGSVFGGLGPYPLIYPFQNLSNEFTIDATAEAAFETDSGIAGVTKRNGVTRTVFLSYPLEAIPDVSDRQAVLRAFAESCNDLSVEIFGDGFESGDTSAWSHP